MSLKEVAARTLKLVDDGRYTAPSGATVEFRDTVERAVSGTRTYTPRALAALCTPSDGPAPEISVVDGTTQVVAQTLAPDLVLLNFASARNVGGGFLNGAKAQEEDVCRCSALYRCLEGEKDYYRANRAHPDALYTDHQIFSPQVPFFRVRGCGELLETPFLADVITAPAPNRGALRSGAGVPETFERRWAHVLAIARDQGRRHLLLGAWGCGAFQNDPVVAATSFQRALQGFGGAFDRVVFAIPGTGKRSLANLRAFESIFG